VVLQCLEVGIYLDVWLHQAEEHAPCHINTLRVKEDCPDNGLKHVTEDLQVVLIELVEVQRVLAVLSAATILHGQQLVNLTYVLVELLFEGEGLVVVEHVRVNAVLNHYQA
jgi:hypothetical protein